MVFNRVQKLVFAAGLLSAGLLVGIPARASVLIEPRIMRGGEAAPVAEPTAAPQAVESTQNIVEVAGGTESFSTLVSALQAANVSSVLVGEGPFTVFAPTNAAFAALPAGTLDALLKTENRDLLVKLLYNHVAYGDVTSDQLSVGQLDTFDGDVSIGITPNGVKVNSANVIQADVDASNGVIHVVDEVLVPIGFSEQLQARINSGGATAATSTGTTTGTTGSVTNTQVTQQPAATTPTAQPAPAAQPAPQQPVRGLW
ncbi:MAG: fasciclin domain-containing protein [Cyanobacteria bacterium J06614_10]